MYYLNGSKDKSKIKHYFTDFLSAFNFQQKEYPDNKILYSKDNIIEIVWIPEWEQIDCTKMEKAI